MERAGKHESFSGRKWDPNKSFSGVEGGGEREPCKNRHPLKTLGCHGSSLYSTVGVSQCQPLYYWFHCNSRSEVDHITAY